MSWQPCPDPTPGDAHAADLIETVIVPRARDLGSFEVRRALPSAQRQMGGAFFFFDQMGPSEFLLGAGMDVGAHPHIGLLTVTYLFDGEVMHRDSLCSHPVQFTRADRQFGTGLTDLEYNENINSQASKVLVGMLWPLEPVTNAAALAAALPHSTSGRLGEAHDQQ